ncbi:hypothetical protein BH10PLA2_BH10PLA2_21880 [soil metagenome]
MRAFLTGVSIAVLLALPIGSTRAAEGDLDVLFKGPGNSSVRAINQAGSVVGFRMLPSKDPKIHEERPFYSSKGKVKVIPKLPKFTASFVTAISDTEIAVGFCSRAAKAFGDPGHNLQAFTWEAATGKLTSLPLPASHERCMAFGISSNGSRISGVCGGADLMNACVWEKTAAGWECKTLPGSENSRLLVTSGACISRDGNSIAAVDGIKPARWTRQADGSWSGKVLKDEDLFIPKAINDAGVMVGYRRLDETSGHHVAVIWTDKDGMKDIGLLPNTHTSQALSINNEGLVVGVSEEPGVRGGPQAFVYQKGKLAPLDMPMVVVSYAYAINEKGQVAGYCGRIDDENVCAFVWTPKKNEQKPQPKPQSKP